MTVTALLASCSTFVPNSRTVSLRVKSIPMSGSRHRCGQEVRISKQSSGNGSAWSAPCMSGPARAVALSGRPARRAGFYPVHPASHDISNGTAPMAAFCESEVPKSHSLNSTHGAGLSSTRPTTFSLFSTFARNYGDQMARRLKKPNSSLIEVKQGAS